MLREKQVTVKELAKEVSLSENYVSTLVKECVDDGILERYSRFDSRMAVRIIDEEVRLGKVQN